MVVRLLAVQVLLVLGVARVDALQDAQAAKVAQRELQALDGLGAPHVLADRAVRALLLPLALHLLQARALDLALVALGLGGAPRGVALRIARLGHGARGGTEGGGLGENK